MNTTHVFFGYFFRLKNDFEQILVELENINTWKFPIFLKINSETIDVKIIQDWIINLLGIENIFDGNLNTPEIINIKCFNGLEENKFYDENHRFHLVKIKCEDDNISISSKFKWIKKTTLFEEKIININASDVTKFHVQLICNDDINIKYKRKFLKCTDLIVFREKPRIQNKSLQLSDIQFLMLKRSDSSSNYEKWEYPKGGLYYHENLNEGAIRELLEETGIGSIGDFKNCGYLGYQNVDVKKRNKEYDALEVHGVTYYFCGNEKLIRKYVDKNLKEKTGEHIDYQWMSFNQAMEAVWMQENNYARIFFQKWKELSRQILNRSYRPTSIAFQITEKCGHSCLYCHRRKVNKKELVKEQVFDIIDILAERGVRKITITGGEPISIGKKNIFEILEYINKKEIHTTLSSTCLYGSQKIGKKDLSELNNYLDHLMISINCFDSDIAKKTYRRIENWKKRLKLALEIITIIKEFEIILEVCTVVTRSNYNHIEEIGKILFDLNPKILWRVDEFYKIGDNCNTPSKFQLDEGDFEIIKSNISKGILKNYSEQVKFNDRKSRFNAPDYMITSQGSIVTTSKNNYKIIYENPEILNILNFKNRRPWNDYKKYCRNWDWITFYD